MPSVQVQVRLDALAMDTLRMLTEDAIQRAIQRTMERVRAYAMSGQSNVPVLTGQLRSSFDIGSTPRSIVFKWSAKNPGKNFDYAMIQDQGGANRYGYIAGKYFSDAARMYAREWFVEELASELSAIGGVGG